MKSFLDIFSTQPMSSSPTFTSKCRQIRPNDKGPGHRTGPQNRTEPGHSRGGATKLRAGSGLAPSGEQDSRDKTRVRVGHMPRKRRIECA